jgi:hypothetical protein
MPTADYSSSRLTNVRNAIALRSYKVANQTAVNAGTSVLREQPSMQLNAVVVARNLTIANQLAAPGEACDCVKPVFTNPGGC